MSYICDKCNKRVLEQDVKRSAFPVAYADPKMEKLLRELSKDVPVEKDYHVAWGYKGYGQCHTQKAYLCGPLSVETEQEYFVHWVGGDMSKVRK